MSKMSSHDSSDAILGEDEELTASLTYINLCSSVYEAYKEHDPFYDTHRISFSAQDDKWHFEWRTRSGFPLLDYKKKWEELREVKSIQPLGQSYIPISTDPQLPSQMDAWNQPQTFHGDYSPLYLVHRSSYRRVLPFSNTLRS
jgi:hypothetical protein